MTGTQAIKASLATSDMLWGMLTEDLSDSDLMVRPVPGANHIAWQWGHILAFECIVHPKIGATTPPLPANFVERHANEKSQLDTAGEFQTRAEYAQIAKDLRGATLAALGKLTDADLDKPNEGKMAAFAPTLGDLLLLLGSHGVMHVGQISAIRRKLGKPIKF